MFNKICGIIQRARVTCHGSSVGDTMPFFTYGNNVVYWAGKEYGYRVMVTQKKTVKRIEKMALKASGTHTLHKDNLPKFDPKIYLKISLNDLIVYAVHYLYGQGREITTEDIVSACFLLFPKKFSLRKYPHWPDSAVVSRRWGDSRTKGYIVGSTALGFKLTPKGFKYAEKVGKALGDDELKHAALPAEMKTRAGRFVRSLEMSDAFHIYKKHGRQSKLNEFDFRSMLLCTMESSPETLTRNLEQFKEYVSLYNRQDLLSLLNFCEERFSQLLAPPKKNSGKPARKSKK